MSVNVLAGSAGEQGNLERERPREPRANNIPFEHRNRDERALDARHCGFAYYVFADALVARGKDLPLTVPKQANQ